MKFFKENDKMPFILVAFGIILYLVLSNLPVVFSGISYVSSVAFPFILGSCVAFIINVPMSFFERKLFYKLKKGKRSLSLIMAIVSIVGVILLVSRLIIPELVDTIFKLSNNIPEYVKEIQALLEKTSMNKPMVHKYVNQITFDWDKISGELITFLQDGATSMLNSTVSAITDVVQFIESFALGFVFEKERQERGLWNIKKTVLAYVILTVIEFGSKRYGIPAGADRRTGVVGRQCAKRQINIGKIHTNPTFPSYDGFIMPQMEENGNYEKCNKL